MLDPNQVNKRQTLAKEKIRRLKNAYNLFVAEFENIEKEEKNLTKEVNTWLDKNKIKKVINYIDSIN